MPLDLAFLALIALCGLLAIHRARRQDQRKFERRKDSLYQGGPL